MTLPRAAFAAALVALASAQGVKKSFLSKGGDGWSKHGFATVKGLEQLSNTSHPLFVTRQHISLIIFCVDWSQHCKATRPQMVEAQEMLDAEYNATGTPVPMKEQIHIAMLDAEDYPKLAERWGVAEYPTYWVHRGWQWSFEVPAATQPRNASDAVAFLKAAAAPGFKAPKDPVIKLDTPAGFFKHAKKEALMLVEFYAPWCKHCKTLEPEYKRAAHALKQHGVVLAKVNGNTHLNKPLGEKYKVKGYPTLVLFRHGQPREYTPPAKDAASIVAFMMQQRHIVPYVFDVASVENVSTTTWLGEHPVNAFVALYGFDHTTAHTEEATTLDRFLNDLLCAHGPERSIMFLKTANATVMKHYKFKPGELLFLPARSLRTKESTLKVDLAKLHKTGASKDGTHTSAALDTILGQLTARATPLVGVMTPYNTPFSEWPLYRLPLVAVFGHVRMKKSGVLSKVGQAWHNVVTDAANNVTGGAEGAAKARRPTFVIADGETFASTLSDFGLKKPSKYRAAVVAIAADRSKYRLDLDKGESINAETLARFGRDFMAGRLAPYIRSAERPTDELMAKTKTHIVVGSSFQEMVTDSLSDVLISFYAPWCKTCESMDPEYEDLALQLEDVEDFVVAKMDASANDVPPHFAVGSLPSMYLAFGGLDAAKKQPIKIEVSAQKGRLGLELVKFLRNHTQRFDDVELEPYTPKAPPPPAKEEEEEEKQDLRRED